MQQFHDFTTSRPLFIWGGSFQSSTTLMYAQEIATTYDYCPPELCFWFYEVNFSFLSQMSPLPPLPIPHPPPTLVFIIINHLHGLPVLLPLTWTLHNPTLSPLTLGPFVDPWFIPSASYPFRYLDDIPLVWYWTVKFQFTSFEPP